MGEYKPNISKSDSDILEIDSIICLESILSNNDLRTHLSANDKTANTDGFIELLKERRIIGKIVVQVKSYPKKYIGKSKFDFPTSLFAYANNIPTDLVFLFAVDKRNGIAYWKHISADLIKRYADKCSQKTINLSFDEFEVVNNRNVSQSILKWKDLYKKLADLIELSEGNINENEQLRKLMNGLQNSNLSIGKNEVINLQKFIDEYNYLLDHEFIEIKNHFFKNSWKIGVAIFEYTQNSLSYLMFRIPYGANDLIIKEIPIDKVSEMESLTRTLYRNCVENSISQSPKIYALKLIRDDVERIMKNKNILFLTPEIANEYIFDFINKEGRSLKLTVECPIDLIFLRSQLEQRYSGINKSASFTIISGHHNINVSILYECICFLMRLGVDKLNRLYPTKGHYGESGFVYDWFTNETAYEKVKFVFEKLPYIFSSYIQAMFPKLISVIDFFSGCNVLIVNLIYPTGNYSRSNSPQLVLYYLYDLDVNNDQHEVVISLDFDSPIFKENGITDYDSMMNHFYSRKMLFFKGNEYDIRRSEGSDMSKFFEDYYIHNLLYGFLYDRFKDYFDTVLQE